MVKISVIIPLYNKGTYILDTIKSVVSQTHADWELLVINNDSTDGGFEKAKQIQDSRISFLECSKKGPGSARNYGLRRARGEWIQFLDADDLLKPDYFVEQLKVAQNNPQSEIIVCCWEEFIDRDPQQKIIKKPAGMGCTSQALKDTAIAFTPWAVHAALIKRDILTQEFMWSEDLDNFSAEDTAFWFPLIDNYQVAYSDRIGVLYRKEIANCRTNLDAENWFWGIHNAVKHNLNYLKSNTRVNGEQCVSLMRLYSGIYSLARHQESEIIAQKSILEANYWLNLYFQKNRRPKVYLIARRFLGIELFLWLQNLSNIKLMNFISTILNKQNLSNIFFKLYYGFKGVPFHIDRETIHLDESLRRWNIDSEAGVHNIIREYLQAEDIFIDVGANFGLHTVYAAKIVGNKGKVFAFEPVQKHLSLLNRNLSLSQVDERVEIVSSALSNSTASSLTFYLPVDEKIAVTASLNTHQENCEQVKVDNTRLDDYWSRVNLQVKLIKIDVEGAELEVLRGAENILRKWKPKLIIEVHGFALPSFGTSVKELKEFLARFGYEEQRLKSEYFNGEEYFQALYY